MMREGRDAGRSSACARRVIYIQTDFQLSEVRTTENRGGTDGKEVLQRGKEKEGESVRDRDSSLGSHVLSQFGVSPPVSFFAPLSSGSTISSPLRRAVFPPLASSSHTPWCGNVASPTNILRKNVHEDAPSRVKRRVHLNARGSSCRLIASRLRHPLKSTGRCRI